MISSMCPVILTVIKKRWNLKFFVSSVFKPRQTVNCKWLEIQLYKDNCNPWQNIWNELESSKIGLDQKIFISAFAYFWDCYYQSFISGRMRKVLSPSNFEIFLRFPNFRRSWNLKLLWNLWGKLCTIFFCTTYQVPIYLCQIESILKACKIQKYNNVNSRKQEKDLVLLSVANFVLYVINSS